MSKAVIKTHYDAETLAAMHVPGLPTTRVAMFKRAKAEGWPFIEVAGRGGKGGVRREYAPPDEIMAAIQAKATQALVATMPANRVALRPEDQLPLIQTDERVVQTDARHGVLLALDTLMARFGYPLKKAARVLIELARNGEAGEQLTAMLKLARDGRGRPSPDGLPSERSVLRFVEYQSAGMLAPKTREVDMSVPPWAKAFLEYYQRPEKPTVEHAYRQFVKALDDSAKAAAPSVWQVRRFLAKVGNVTLQMGRMGDREIKSLKPFIRRDFANLLPSDIYSADGHTFDAEVQHPMHGRPFRPEITSVIDIATRKVVGWSLDLAESGFAVLDALRAAALTGGIPAIFYVDNGSGYKNDLMTDVGVGLMSRLGTEMINSLPYNSQARGVIEKLHQTIWVNAAKELPGFMGREMDRQAKQVVHKLSRQAIKKKPAGEAVAMPLLGWDAFVAFAEEKVAEYNNRPHRSLPKIADANTGRRRHMTPNEAWMRAEDAGFASFVVTDDEARPLFRPQVLRTVQRGEINLFSNRYFSRQLEEFHGDQLRIGYDIHDAEKVWVYTAEGRFICTAELNGNQRPYVAPSVMDQARDKRLDGKVRRLEVKLDEAHAERRGTPAIEQSDTVSIPGFMSMSISQLAERARLAQVVEVTPVAPPVQAALIDPMPDLNEWTIPATAQERFTEWQRLNNLREEDLDSEKQKKWRHTYQATAEFRAFQRKTA